MAFNPTVTPEMPETSDMEPAKAEKYEAYSEAVKPEALVENRITGLLSKGSPYMTDARTRAKQEGNRRGLLNSSMAVGAGELAAIQSALPIAQQDATTYGTAQLERNKAINAARSQGAELGTQTNLANLDARNRMDLTRADNIAAQQQAAQGKEIEKELSTLNAALEESLRSGDHGRAQQINQQKADLKETLRASEYGRTVGKMDIEQTFKERTMLLDENVRSRLMASEQENAVQLESVRQNFEIMKNLDTSMGTMYDGALRSISNVLDNPDMKPAQADKAVDVIVNNLAAGLEFLSGVSGKRMGYDGSTTGGITGSGTGFTPTVVNYGGQQIQPTTGNVVSSPTSSTQAPLSGDLAGWEVGAATPVSKYMVDPAWTLLDSSNTPGVPDSRADYYRDADGNIMTVADPGQISMFGRTDS